MLEGKSNKITQNKTKNNFKKTEDKFVLKNSF